jgi:hypothetical protein
VDSGAVGSNVHRPSAAGRDGAAFDATSHSRGAVTDTVNRALRSGWSKHGMIRRAPSRNMCAYRYT